METHFLSQVIGTKTKIHIVMEYVSGGQLSDRMVSSKQPTLESEFSFRDLTQDSDSLELFISSPMFAG